MGSNGLTVGEQFAKSVMILRDKIASGACAGDERIAMHDSGTVGTESLDGFLQVMHKIAAVYPYITFNVLEDPEPAPEGVRVEIHTTGRAVDLLVFFLLCATSGALEYAG